MFLFFLACRLWRPVSILDPPEADQSRNGEKPDDGLHGLWHAAVFPCDRVPIPAGAGIYWIMSNIIAFAQMILLNYTHSPKKIIAKMMVEETVNRRSKEENMKRVAQREMEA